MSGMLRVVALSVIIRKLTYVSLEHFRIIPRVQLLTSTRQRRVCIYYNPQVTDIVRVEEITVERRAIVSIVLIILAYRGRRQYCHFRCYSRIL